MENPAQLINPLLSTERLLLLSLAVVACGVWASWRSSTMGSARVRIGCAVARGLVLCVLMMIAFNPGRWTQPQGERHTEWAMVVDRSASMAVGDGTGGTRWQEAVRITDKAAKLAADPADVRRATLTDTVESQQSFDHLSPDGATTDIPGGLLSFLRSYRAGGTRLTGLILLSDGRQVGSTPETALVQELRSLAVPLHVVPLGGPVPKRDISIAPAQRHHVAFVGQKLRFQAVIKAEGVGAIAPPVRLIDAAGKTVTEARPSLATNGTANVMLDVTPAVAGYATYQLTVDAAPDEADTANNESTVSLTVLQSKLRVLMAEGIPYWDTKFLTQLLRKQANFDVTSIYRVSSDRFFKVDTDLANVSDASESIFPDTAQALSQYDLVVLGKGMEYILTPQRIQLLQDYVRQQGGCVVFSRGKPYGDVFPGLEPLEPVQWGDSLGSRFRIKPTVAGSDVGLFGDALPGVDSERWGLMPLLQGATRPVHEKAFSQTLMEGVVESSGGGSPIVFPALVSLRYGKGVVVTLNTEGLWQWSFFPSDPLVGQTYSDFWVQLITWAGTYAEFLPGQAYSLRLSDSSVQPDVPVRAIISHRSETPVAQAPIVSVWNGTDRIQQVSSVAVPGADRQWEAVLSLKMPGLYRVDLGESTLAPSTVLHIMNPPKESDELSADPTYLEALAHESGGRVISESDLPDVVKQFSTDRSALEAGQPVWVPFWDRAILLIGIVAGLGFEWTLRRRNGLL